MNIRCILSLILLLASLTLYAQQNASEEIRFANYLISKKNYDEAVFVLEQIITTSQLQSIKDSAYFLLGKSYYNNQQLKESLYYFDQVSNQIKAIKVESVFFSAFNQAYSGQSRSGIEKLKSLELSDDRFSNLRNFELAGMSLLIRDFEAYDSLISSITQTSYEFSEQQKTISIHRSNLLSAKNKSVFMGGLMSAIIPGSGKIYAGRTGQGIYNFFIAGILGLQTLEAYNKNGAESFRFIAYATLFSSFYIGNIWGSALAVKVKRDEKLQAIDQQILFDLHIPLRNIFR